MRPSSGTLGLTNTYFFSCYSSPPKTIYHTTRCQYEKAVILSFFIFLWREDGRKYYSTV
jgi:hypothetical protein